jgi:hypothetical protein
MQKQTIKWLCCIKIYVNLYVEFVVKNPLRKIDGPVGVETSFHLALDQFVQTLVYIRLLL